MHSAACAMACSGSVSLELLHYAVPTVILYWISRPAYFVQGLFRKSKYITLVNLLADHLNIAGWLSYRAGWLSYRAGWLSYCAGWLSYRGMAFISRGMAFISRGMGNAGWARHATEGRANRRRMKSSALPRAFDVGGPVGGDCRPGDRVVESTRRSGGRGWRRWSGCGRRLAARGRGAGGDIYIGWNWGRRRDWGLGIRDWSKTEADRLGGFPNIIPNPLIPSSSPGCRRAVAGPAGNRDAIRRSAGSDGGLVQLALLRTRPRQD